MALTSFAAGAEFTVEGHRVFYGASGRGRTAVVLVHGWSCNSSFWRLQRPALEKQFRVLAIDLPGHGRSDKPEIEYTPVVFSSAVRRMLDAEKVSAAVLVGHSMGAMVIRQVLADDPRRVLALVTVDGAMLSGPGIQRWAAQFASALRGPEHDEAATRFIERLLPAAPAELRDDIRRKMLSTPAHVAASAVEKTLGSNIWVTMAPAAVPVLAIHAPGARKPELERVFPNLEYHELENVSHFLMLEKPDEINRLILDFVRRLE
jgi:pimeloyl-ACP methyl ester carboxylesterase